MSETCTKQEKPSSNDRCKPEMIPELQAEDTNDTDRCVPDPHFMLEGTAGGPPDGFGYPVRK